MDPNLTWDLIALRGTQLDHLKCSRMIVGDVAGVTAWVYIVQWCTGVYSGVQWHH